MARYPGLAFLPDRRAVSQPRVDPHHVVALLFADLAHRGCQPVVSLEQIHQAVLAAEKMLEALGVTSDASVKRAEAGEDL